MLRIIRKTNEYIVSENAELVNVKADGTYIYHCAW
jgi:hypothetical protein